jgi:hypothetical protein
MSLDGGLLDHGSIDGGFVEEKPQETPQETVSFSESFKKIFSKKISDTVSTTETVQEPKNLTRKSDSLSFIDTLKKILRIGITDTITTTDNLPQYYYLGDTLAIGSLHSLSGLTSKRTGTRILAGHKIIGTTISSVSVRLKRILLTTGTLYVRVRDNNDNIISEASIDSSILDSNENTYLFTFTPVTIQANYRISVEYENGNLTNYVQVYGSTTTIPTYTEVFEYTNAYLDGQAYAMFGIFAP